MSSPYPACIGLSPAGPVLGLGWSMRATCLLPSAAPTPPGDVCWSRTLGCPLSLLFEKEGIKEGCCWFN